MTAKNMTFWGGSGSGSMPLTNGSGSWYFRHWPSRCQQKTHFLTQFFLLITFWRYIYIIFSKIKSRKESQNSRNQGFSYYFCMMIEGSGSGSIPLTNGSGSGRPKNMWIRWIRIRICNTGLCYEKPVWGFCCRRRRAPWQLQHQQEKMQEKERLQGGGHRRGRPERVCTILFLAQKSNQNTWFSATIDISLAFPWFSAFFPTLCTVISKKTRGCMHRRVFIKKTWLSAFSYAQSRISLVFCRSLGFLVLWFSSLTAESDLVDLFVLCMEKKVGGLYLFVCIKTDMFECLQLW